MSYSQNPVSEPQNSTPRAVSAERPRLASRLVLSGIFCAILVGLPLLAGGNELYALSALSAKLVIELMMLILVVSWWIVRMEQGRWARVPPAVLAAMAVFFAANLLATGASINPYVSGLSLIQLGIGLLLFYLTADLVRTEADLHATAWALLWSGGLVAAYGIEQGMFGLPNWLLQAQANRASQNLIDMVSQGRVFATFANVNAFAAYLVMILPIGMYLMFRAGTPGSQLLSGALVLLLLIALAMTGSKGGWLAALAVSAGTAWYVARGDGWRRLFRRIGLVALTALLIVGFLWVIQPAGIENPLERLFAVTMGLKNSSEGRWAFWRGAVELIGRHPLLGIGPGAFGAGFEQVQSDGYYSRYAHDLYLQVATETGLLGLLAFAGLLGAVGATAAGAGARRAWTGVILMSGAALLLHGVVDFSWEIPANQWLFFVLCGLVIALWRMDRGEAGEVTGPASDRGRAAGMLAAVPLAVLCLLAVGRPYLAEGYLQSAIAASIADDVGRSIELASEAVRFGPGSARAQNFLATAYRRQWEKTGDHSALQEAAARHERAIDLAPAIGLYYGEWGKTLWALDRREEAVEAWRQAHTRYPINPAIAVQLGSGLWSTGRRDEALQLLRETVRSEPLFLAAGSPELLPFFDLHFALAKMYDENNDIDSAMAEYQRVLDLTARSPDRIAYGPLLAGRIAIEPKLWYAPRSYLEMGDLYQRHGQTRQALVAYRRAVELDANYIKARQRIRLIEEGGGAGRL